MTSYAAPISARFEARLQNGDAFAGTILSLADVALAELAASAFDLVWIDLEHGALSLRDAQAMTVAVQGSGAAAFVRITRPDTEALPALLDAGIDGVVLPGVETPEEVRALVRRLRYPPEGERGFGPRRAGGYGRTIDFWSSPAARVVCVVQIESTAAVEAAFDIASIGGVDALVVGCTDLSFSLGKPQQLGSPELHVAVARVRAAAADAGVGFGVAGSGDISSLLDLAGPGVQLLVYSADVRIYARAVDEVAAALGAHKAEEKHRVST